MTAADTPAQSEQPLLRLTWLAFIYPHKALNEAWPFRARGPVSYSHVAEPILT